MTRHPIRALCFGFTMFLLAGTIGAQEVSRKAIEKADPPVIARAVAGASQLAFVTLDTSEIDAKADAARIARALPFQDRLISDQVSRALDQLKAEIFPDGKMGSVVLMTGAAHESPSVAQVTVRLPDLSSLLELVEHPRVKRVHDYYQVFPASERELLGERGRD